MNLYDWARRIVLNHKSGINHSHTPPSGRIAVKVSNIDLHGLHLSDALPKLCGLATFADEFGDEFHRIEAVAQMEDGTLRVLDLTEEKVRKTIREASDAEQLYLSVAGRKY